MNRNLAAPISKAKMKLALKQMHPAKTLGSNGFLAILNLKV